MRLIGSARVGGTCANCWRPAITMPEVRASRAERNTGLCAARKPRERAGQSEQGACPCHLAPSGADRERMLPEFGGTNAGHVSVHSQLYHLNYRAHLALICMQVTTATPYAFGHRSMLNSIRHGDGSDSHHLKDFILCRTSAFSRRSSRACTAFTYQT